MKYTVIDKRIVEDGTIATVVTTVKYIIDGKETEPIEVSHTANTKSGIEEGIQNRAASEKARLQSVATAKAAMDQIELNVEVTIEDK